MNKRAARESAMSDDNRIVKLESDVRHLQSDVTEIKEHIKSLRARCGERHWHWPDFFDPDPYVQVGYGPSENGWEW
jgi:hypothetical protein